MKLSTSFYNLHSDPGFNYNLNRLAWTISIEELKEVANKIETISDWISVMKFHAKVSEKNEKYLNAARYYQAAEFYMPHGDPEKAEIYKHSISLINETIPEIAENRFLIPYKDGFLPAIKLEPSSKPKDIIVWHGGFDSLLEEMYPMLKIFCDAGFLIIAFEGPGQGGALRTHNLKMTYDWEKPISVVLDFFDVKKCVLIGMSLGGYLAARAAAFERRIYRLVCWGALHDFSSAFKSRLGERKFKFLEFLLDMKLSFIVNPLVRRQVKKDDILSWALQHGMHVSGASSPFEYYDWVRMLNLKEVAHLINCHSYLVMGNEDHLVPIEQVYIEAQSMKNAESVTTIMLSKAQEGAEHCQIGNAKLVLDNILRWLDSLD